MLLDTQSTLVNAGHGQSLLNMSQKLKNNFFYVVCIYDLLDLALYIALLYLLFTEYYSVLYLNPKSATDDVPSAETFSVVLLEPPVPPRSKTSPEGSPQQR